MENDLYAHAHALEVEESPREGEMARAADGQEFRHALQHGQEKDLERNRHRKKIPNKKSRPIRAGPENGGRDGARTRSHRIDSPERQPIAPPPRKEM